MRFLIFSILFFTASLPQKDGRNDEGIASSECFNYLSRPRLNSNDCILKKVYDLDYGYYDTNSGYRFIETDTLIKY